MNKRTLAVASAALLTFAGGAYAVAGGSAPTAITSSVTDKLTDAITAKYPGSTIVGIRSEPGGGYEVEVRKSDATEVHVSVDAGYKVTGERTGGMRGGMGGRGHGGMGHGGFRMLDTAALAKTLGVSEDKLTAAIDKVRKANDPRADRAAAIAKALGADVKDVQSVLDAQHDAGGPGRGDDDHGGPGDRGPGSGHRAALVTALAKKLNVSESKVKDALDAARPDKSDRRDELATAIAKELGLDADKVQKAIEAQRPAAPVAPTTP